MNSNIDLANCLTFINCQLKPAATSLRGKERTYRAVTISREAGAGGHSLAEQLAQLLQSEEPQPAPPWNVFDRNLVERVLEDHNLPARLARFMPEDHVSGISDTMDELFGLHPPSWLLVRKTAETMLRLAALGNVILIGRGANVITSRIDHVFHVRLVGSLEKRVERLQQLHGSDPHAALHRAQNEDLARRRYLKQFFGKNIDDPLLYHLTINTDRVSLEQAARMIQVELNSTRLAIAAEVLQHASDSQPQAMWLS
jgi:hypothetical protein